MTATYSGMGTPTAITDALLSGNVDVVGIGLPAFLTMWDKTRGNMNVRGIVAMNRQPAYPQHAQSEHQVDPRFHRQ